MRPVLTLFATVAIALPAVAQRVDPTPPPAPPAKPAGPQLNDVRPLKPRPVTADASNPEAPVNGVVILYGNQKCPTNAAGEEVVVCARRSAAEQFRIPKELRAGTLKPEYESFANRGQSILDAARTGVGACEPFGAASGAACTAAEYSAWKKQRDAARKADNSPK